MTENLNIKARLVEFMENEVRLNNKRNHNFRCSSVQGPE